MIACYDSHTSTHAAGAVVRTSQARDASQCLAMDPLKVRRIRVEGPLAPGVYAKDVILAIIQRLGVKGGVGHAYEYAGSTIDAMSMDERMTICNMSIEGGAATSTPMRRRSATSRPTIGRRARQGPRL
jgi:3-isopropylmalate/(R)-2-methylmalate dehydratase large subunit